jgi:hypothetical protein
MMVVVVVAGGCGGAAAALTIPFTSWHDALSASNSHAPVEVGRIHCDVILRCLLLDSWQIRLHVMLVPRCARIVHATVAADPPPPPHTHTRNIFLSFTLLIYFCAHIR